MFAVKQEQFNMRSFNAETRMTRHTPPKTATIPGAEKIVRLAVQRARMQSSY